MVVPCSPLLGLLNMFGRRELSESGCVRHALQSHFTILKHLFGLGVLGLLDYGKNHNQDYFD